MSTDDSLPRWRDPLWQHEALDWVSDRLAEQGIQLRGSAEQVKARPWSTVFRVPTTAAPAWFKANARGSRYEAALVAVLAQWSPEQVVAPVAVDTDRGWLLLRDGGPTLREATESGGRPTDLGAWERLLVEHAAFQRSLERRVEELLALGVPDNRPETLPALRLDLLGDRSLLRMGHADGLTEDQRRALLADSPAYARLCAELAAIGVPPSLQHDDLHDNNVFADRFRAGRQQPLRVFDWGDAVVGHPFTVLLISLGTVADLIGVPDGAPELGRLRDAYLDAWSDVADLASLREAARLALRVGGVVRAASYRRALLEATPAGLDQWGARVPAWLLELYASTPLEPTPPPTLRGPGPGPPT